MNLETYNTLEELENTLAHAAQALVDFGLNPPEGCPEEVLNVITLGGDAERILEKLRKIMRDTKIEGEGVEDRDPLMMMEEVHPVKGRLSLYQFYLSEPLYLLSPAVPDMRNLIDEIALSTLAPGSPALEEDADDSS